ncbi:MAG: hypothetical protein KDC46_07325 [Thermoleophilia bacterium]|nr:hypothetical protein [Thermoleophilia bacterium]
MIDRSVLRTSGSAITTSPPTPPLLAFSTVPSSVMVVPASASNPASAVVVPIEPPTWMLPTASRSRRQAPSSVPCRSRSPAEFRARVPPTPFAVDAPVTVMSPLEVVTPP